MTHKIGILAGDGIGPEVIAEALKVVRAAGVQLDTVDYDLGGRRYLATGEVPWALFAEKVEVHDHDTPDQRDRDYAPGCPALQTSRGHRRRDRLLQRPEQALNAVGPGE